MMGQSRFTDPEYIKHDQYRDPANLGARIRLHQRFSLNPTGFYPWIIEQMNLPEAALILEVGCGSANLWASTLERARPGWRVLLTDLSQGMVRNAQRSLGGDTRFRFGVVEAGALPFPEQTFDRLVANHMLYHVPDLRGALKEIQRVLKTGGALHASTNGATHLRELRLLAQSAEELAAWDQIYAGFSLESGEAALAEFFRVKAVARYPDGLEITEVEPVIDFLRSTLSMRVELSRLDEIRSYVGERIRSEGAFRVSKDSGMFTAVKEGGGRTPVR